MKKQSGFSIIEIIMVIVILMLLGTVGWLFWDKITNKPAANKVATVQSKSLSPTPSPTVSNKTFNAQSIGVAFEYPSSWTPLDASDYPFKANSPLDIHKTLKSQNGFELVFSTLSATGLGGTGPCPQVTGFQNHGESKIPGVYVVSMDDGKGGIILQLSANKTEQDQSTKCMYQNIISISEPKYASNNDMYTVKPYAFTFGTFASYDSNGNAGSTPKPSSKDMNDAVMILKTARKL